MTSPSPRVERRIVFWNMVRIVWSPGTDNGYLMWETGWMRLMESC
jgi:hypothetical protein